MIRLTFTPCLANSLNRGGKSAFNSPSVSKPLVQSGDMDAGFCRPVFKTKRFSLVGNPAVISFVSTVLFSTGPFAVFRGVAAVIINALKRMIQGFFAHVLNKVFRGFSPTCADLYTPAAIVEVERGVRSMAALDHTVPSFIKRVFTKAVFEIHISSIHEKAGAA